ncbi:MAG: glycoside hydrolase family 65 [Gemmatimonadaceae bacterium]
MKRREFLRSGSAGMAGGVLLPHGARPAADGESPRDAARSAVLDRRARVRRHSPVVRTFDAYSALSVGNGGFAFTVDATGLQTFAEEYKEIPLATQAEWGWHSFANPSGFRAEDAMERYDAHGRQVPYLSGQSGPAGKWLRENPHRLSLGRIGFVLRRRDGSASRASDIGGVEQRLDLWSGTIETRFTLDDRAVRVWTWAHPARDLVAFRVESTDIGPAWLAIRIAFPYGGVTHTGDPSDWTHPELHTTRLAERGARAATWERTLDATTYWARAAWTGDALVTAGPNEVRPSGPHEFRIEPAAGASRFECCIEFSPARATDALPSADATAAASARKWERFWTDGGTLDLSGSSDPRATELERRIVLSEYLTAIQCAGTMPPQETGETFNSWFGKAHLEMHWWHAAHFALWDRADLLERSLPWYRKILPEARANAARQGYRGARWPKMVGPDGRDSPSGIGPFLIWQQPHPIYLSELVYRAHPQRRVLERYRDIVFASAEFMASYPWWEQARRRYVLGPPLIPAQESHPPRTTFNPTFELAYWAFALSTAQRWRERLGLAREPAWERVLNALSPLPMRDGLYVNAESAPTTFTDADQRRDHPTLLGAYGFVASLHVDREAMRRTLRRVFETWQWSETWGWDYPLVAMTAARLGEPSLAIDALLMDTPKNRYHPNGHNYQRPGLTIYLPGNGGLLSATAMMAAGWEGAPRTSAPGFPRAGWSVGVERLRGLP